MYIATSFTAALAAFIVLQTFHSSHSPPPIRGRPCICVLATGYAICPEPMTLRESGCDDAVRVKVAPEAFMDSGEVAKLERGELAKPGRRTEGQARGSVAAKSDASLELGAFIGGGGGGTTTPGVTATASASGTIYIDAQSWVNMLTAMIVFAAAFGIMLTYQFVVIIKHVVQRRRSRHSHHTSIAATDDAVAAVPGGGHHGGGGLGGGFGGGGGGFGGGGFGGGGFGGGGRGGFGGGGRGGCGGRGGDKRYGDDDGHGGAAARISETDEPYEVEASTESEAELERAEQERRGKSTTVLSNIFSRRLLGIRVPSHPDYELLRKLMQRKRRFYGQEEDMPEKPKQPRRRASFAGSFSDFMQSPDVGKTLAELTSTTNGAVGGGNPFAGQQSSSSTTNPFFAGEQSSNSTNPFFVAPDVGQRTQEQPSAASESISGAAARIADNIAVDERIVNVHLEHSRARKALEEKEQQLDGVRKSLAKAQAAESFCNLF